MQKEDLDFFKKWLLDYVDQFSSSEVFIQENVELKIKHTARVCENILLIAKAENMEEKGCRLAEAIALFHDLGRFEQFTKYRTFKDSESENHALLGVKILENTGILSILSRKEKDIILKAVEYHNRMEIPECTETTREFLFYLKLIRDADKLDILKLVSEDYKKEEEFRNPALEFNIPDTPGCSENIVADILNNRMAKLADVKTGMILNSSALAGFLTLVFLRLLPFSENAVILRQFYTQCQRLKKCRWYVNILRGIFYNLVCTYPIFCLKVVISCSNMIPKVL